MRFPLITASLLAGILLASCTLSDQEQDTPDLVATWVAATLTALDVPAPIPSETPTLIEEAADTPLPAITETPQSTSTPQNPLVLETILCWKGPGAQFEVVSSLKKGERVELIGRATIPGWWIVNNPIYHDPCWAQAEYIQLESGYNVNILPLYTPPPTPTSTPTATRTPTLAPSATNTP